MQGTAFLSVHSEPRLLTFVTPASGNPHCTDEEIEAQRDFVPGPRSDQEITAEASVKRRAVSLCPQDHTTALLHRVLRNQGGSHWYQRASPVFWANVHLTNQHLVVHGSSNHSFFKGNNEQVMSHLSSTHNSFWPAFSHPA